MTDQKHSWPPPPPPARLEQSLFRDARRLEDIDTAVWLYLCELVPDSGGTYRDRVAKMLASVSPELQRYYLTRLFDWERGSGGLESCMMREEDDLFLSDTIAAYEFLGAKQHAQIIRELIPIAKARWKAIEAAEAAVTSWHDETFFGSSRQWYQFEVRSGGAVRSWTSDPVPGAVFGSRAPGTVIHWAADSGSVRFAFPEIEISMTPP